MLKSGGREYLRQFDIRIPSLQVSLSSKEELRTLDARL